MQAFGAGCRFFNIRCALLPVADQGIQNVLSGQVVCIPTKTMMGVLHTEIKSPAWSSRFGCHTTLSPHRSIASADGAEFKFGANFSPTSRRNFGQSSRNCARTTWVFLFSSRDVARITTPSTRLKQYPNPHLDICLGFVSIFCLGLESAFSRTRETGVYN